ncbi:N-6 DNA methylase [Rubrivirga sp. IMCC43871]|uniref:N-6 DNA methylase n=1 Tax=Rubrivirga sp. IMCC43871 TaxID=3391575 RepID=UPI00398FBE38
MKPQPDAQKLRGGYYTPPVIASFLARWAIRDPADEVLEPSCGDGEILTAGAEQLLALGARPDRLARQVVGVEYDAEEAAAAASRLDRLAPGAGASVASADFFSFCAAEPDGHSLFGPPMETDRRFDAVLGNPPFIRYQHFPEAHRAPAFEMMRAEGLNPNRLTNAWLPFLVVGASRLKPGGRLGMVIPAELFQVGYAAETRQHLTEVFSSLVIVAFRELVFEGVQQEVVLILGERGETEEGVRVVEVDSAADLAGLDLEAVRAAPAKPMDHSSEKWTQYFLDADEIKLLRDIRSRPGVYTSGDVIDVDVGIVTGNNKYFVLNREKAEDREVVEYTDRIVTRSAHLEGATFTEADWETNSDRGHPTLLFRPPPVDAPDLPRAAAQYVTEGEEGEQHRGYKCRIRKRWYVVPSVWTPDAFMLRQVHGYPKLILNVAGATCTDTIHRVRFTNGRSGQAIAAAFVNSLTLAASEVTGRSYGGGVLTFEPSEAEDLPLPLEGSERLDLELVDVALRENDVERVLDHTDQILLRDGLGLSEDEINRLRSIWTKLRDRRINRR